MHIVDITMFYSSLSGGVRTYLNAKHRILRAQAGIQHTMLVPGIAPSTWDGIHVLPAPAIPFGRGFRFPLKTRAWRERLLQLAPDIIEAGDPYRLPWVALDAGQRLGVPVAAFYHSDLPQLARVRFGRAAGVMAERYVCHLYAHFDLVLTPSRIMATRLAALGIPRVVVQPLGVDVDRFHPRRRDSHLRSRLGLPDATRLLIFAGRGTREKNIPLLLETLRQLGPGYHLLLVGPDMPVDDLPRNVTVYPNYHNTLELARLLASADALIHAGARETFGLVVLEAMASGLPVIGTAFGAVAELVEPGLGVLATDVSAASLAAAAEALFLLDHHAMGRLARRRSEAQWSWDGVFRQLLAHYAGTVTSAAHSVLGPAHASRG